MTDQDGYEEVVLLFDEQLAKVDLELRAADFHALVQSGDALAGHADGQARRGRVHAAFVVVAAGLSVRSMVFFTFKMADGGVVDSTFNLPLRYLADSAGHGPDLGAGPIRLACRGQCPVPWHSVNLWQPVTDGDHPSIELVQSAVWTNRLGIKPTGTMDQEPDAGVLLLDDPGEYSGPELHAIIEPDPEQPAPDPEPRRDDDMDPADPPDNDAVGGGQRSLPPAVDPSAPEPAGATPPARAWRAPPERPKPRSSVPERPETPARGNGASLPPPGASRPPPFQPSVPPPPPPPPALEQDFLASQRELEARLTETFGEEGRISMENIVRQHNQRLTEITVKYRGDLAEQQRGYLEQIRACREEIQQLKAALRNEQQRSRRLQSLLRGDP